ncbi:MAG: MBL fold metallo-hydrolase [Planctomycetota bacterium]
MRPECRTASRLIVRVGPAVSIALWVLLAAGCVGGRAVADAPSEDATREPLAPYVVLLGTAQDAGSPQVNSPADHPARIDPSKRRYATCLGIVDPATGRRWMIDATPDFREQAWLLSRAEPEAPAPIGLDGVFVTHAHIGHYTGLMFVGHESMGAHDLPVYAAPRMCAFLRHNGPWSQLVRYDNIELVELTAGEAITLSDDLRVTPFLVPHRQEYAEVVGFRVDGPERSALYLPDIDSWDEWAAQGTEIADLVRTVDVAYLDATFFDDDEIPGRDMSGFPHPRISASMDRFEELTPEERGAVRFIHLNHTNPAQWENTPERREVERRGFAVGRRGERFEL